MINSYVGVHFGESRLFWPSETSTGVVNDHVGVQAIGDSKLFSVYLREDYNICGGPRSRQDGHKNLKELYLVDRRGWRKCTPLVEEVPFDEALAKGREVAAEKSVALYVDKNDGKRTFIDSCPENWTPRVA